MGRPGRQADVEMAESLLLDVRLCTEALSQIDHPLRQLARRRQDHLWRIFPHGPVARAHHDGYEGRAVQGRSLAEISARQCAQGVEAGAVIVMPSGTAAPLQAAVPCRTS